MRKISIFVFVLMLVTVFLSTTTPLLATNPSGITTHADELEWWKDQRFGMFIHWGPVALRGYEISWSRGGQIPKTEYDNLYQTFNPIGFNAGQWVQIAQDAGVNYMVLTAKHHDGFCEFNSALTQYKITSSACPFGRDVTKELATACNNAGMGWGIYYSPTDWYVDDYPSSIAPLTLGTYYSNQVVDELLTNYGRVDTIWFDLGGISGVNGSDLLNRMRQKQPWVLVNNRGNMGSLGDYSTPEQTIGTFDNDHRWESCMTIQASNQWAWDPDGGLKPLKQLVDMIVNCACGGGNCLLNIGPRPDGVIDPPMVTRLQEIGNFIKPYGESIYGTSGGPVKNTMSWGGTTSKGNTMYVHLLDWTGEITIPSPSASIISSSCLTGGTPTVTQGGGQISLSLPPANIHPLDTIIKIVFDSVVELTTPLTPSDGTISNGKPATQSSTFPNYPAGNAVDGDTGNFSHTNSEAQAWWQVDLQGTFNIGDIKIYNREGFLDRLSDFWVYVLDNNGNQVWSNHQTTYPNPTVTLNTGGVSGRYVKIQLTGTNYLTLCEVKVFSTNLAKGKPATQSSTYGGADAGRAVDGNQNGNYFNNSVTHTNSEAGAWWKVDLGSINNIGEIKIFNRTDACMDRLSDYYVSVLDQNQNQVWSNHQTTYPNPSVTVNAGGVSGRYVKIQLTGTNYLSLAEVEVYPAPASSGLAGYWKFNETSGTTAADSSGNNNTGTVSGATWTTGGKNGGALSFDGINDFVSVNNSSSLSLTQFTVAMWVNLTNLPAANSYYALAVKGADMAENYELLVGYPNAGGIHFPVKWTDGNRSGDSSSTQLAAGNWNHVVLTYDGASAKVYINSVLDTTKTYNKTPLANTGQLIIGNESAMSRYLKGKLDEVRIYNRALSQQEITNLYNYTGN
jgi:alpha-L-fucosidase